ncbi:MAG: hypothetical protein LBE09_02070 [Christensenellaceae bacterium]|nr:hypothetical protein [Christensenellaceae bacterium]
MYDIYKLFPYICFDDAFRALVRDVREARKVSEYNRSASDNIDIKKLLLEIIENNAHEGDYTGNLYVLLYENIAYNDAKNALLEILKQRF